MTSASPLDQALAFAAMGWPVFPCNPKIGVRNGRKTEKTPLLGKLKDADGKPIPNSGGVSRAPTDPVLIREWWGRWPKALVGIAMGRNGLLALDFDPRTDAETGEMWTLERLKSDLEAQMGCALPRSLSARTPSDGIHVYFRQPDDGGPPINNRGNLPEHVDVRGLGGYVIAPDGALSDGTRYRWLRGGPGEIEIVDAPEALIRILRMPGRGEATPRREARPQSGDRVPAGDISEAQRRWALSALDAEISELAATPVGGGNHGGRNEGAFHAAFVLGQIVAAGALSESMVRAALLDAIKGFGSDHSQAVENGLQRGLGQPRDLSKVGTRAGSRRGAALSGPPPAPHPADGGGSDAPFQNGNDAPDTGQQGGTGGKPRKFRRIKPDPDPERDQECAFLPMTDLGNAERFRVRHGHRFRFCKELGWFVWDSRRWKLLSEEKDKEPGEVTLAVMETVRAIRNEADLVEASGDRGETSKGLNYIVKWRGSGDNKEPVFYSDTLRDHAKSSEGANRLKCVGGLAKAFQEIAISTDAMDADRMAINVLNGTLRIVTRGNRAEMRLFPHNPDDLISKVANVVYDPDATCEDYDSFMETVQPSEQVRRFLSQWGGLSLTGDIKDQRLAFFHGKGRNGKSTLVDTWAHIAGDYGGSVAIETFLDQGRGRKGGEATPDLARLPGVRFLRTSEPEKGSKLAEALIKLVTGGEGIDARHLNKGFFTFLPSFKLTISGNHKPKITGHDDGIWRRVMLVPWAVQIAKDKVDKSLPDKLKKQGSGILNRMLDGLIDWVENGLIEPEEVAEATRKYRESSDQLGRFLDHCTKIAAGSRAKSSQLFALFSAWSKATGSADWSTQGFSKAMEDRGFEKIASNGMFWIDIEMTASVDDFTERKSGGGDDQQAPAPPPYEDDGGGLQDFDDLP